MPGEMPPLVQEMRANASQLLETQDKVKRSTKDMADETVASGERQKGSWLSTAKGMVVGQLAVDALRAAFRGLQSVISTGIQEAKDASAENAQLAAGIKSTGNAAGVTVTGMNALASSIQAYSGQTDDSIAKTQGLLLTFTNIRNVGADKIFDDVTRAAADMAARMGGDASSKAIVLGKALNDPVKGITALTRVGVQFTQAQKDQIAAMQAAGDTIGAQKIILSELNKEFGGSAEAAGKTFPGAIDRAKRSFEDLSQGVVDKFLPVVIPAINGMVSALQAAAPVAEAVAGHIADVFSKIGPAIEVVKGAFNGVSRGVDLGPISAGLQTFGGILRTISDAAKPILDALKAGFQQLAPVFGPLITQFATLASTASPTMLILKALAPVIPQLVGVVVQLATTLGGVLGTTLTTLLPIISKIAGLLGGELAKIFLQLAPIIGKLAEMLGSFLGSTLTTLLPIVLKLADFIGQLLEAVIPLLDPIFGLVTAFSPLIGILLPLISQILPPLVDLISGILDVTMPLVTGLISFLVPALSMVAKIATSILIPVVKEIAAVLGGLIDFVVGVFTGNWKKAWGGIVEIFSGIFNGIKGIVLAVLNGVIDIINGVISGVNGIAGAVKDATGGAINIHIGSLPHLSFDTGADRVPGVRGAALVALIHGGEAIASNNMIEGREPLPPRIMSAAEKQLATQAPTAPAAPSKVTSIGAVNFTTQANPRRIMADLGWLLEREG